MNKEEEKFVIEELRKIKLKRQMEYYDSPIMSEEEWRDRYPHSDTEDIPDYIPCWRDIDEIIYQRIRKDVKEETRKGTWK